jgi:hypothetical protein
MSAPRGIRYTCPLSVLQIIIIAVIAPLRFTGLLIWTAGNLFIFAAVSAAGLLRGPEGVRRRRALVLFLSRGVVVLM